MVELWLKYKDENGEERSRAVDVSPFFIGRQKGKDITIEDGRLSREHLKIERYGDVFVAADCGSSNGTKRNGVEMHEAAGLVDGDELDLGGIIVKVEIDDPNAGHVPDEYQYRPEVAAVDKVSSAQTVQQQPGGIPTAFLIMIPVFSLLLIVFIVGGVYIYSTEQGRAAAVNNRPNVNTEDDFFDDDPVDRSTPTPRNADSTPTPSDSGQLSAGGGNESSSGDSNSGADNPVQQDLSDTEKVEKNGAAFLRKAAHNDPKYFLTSAQAKLVEAKIGQLRNSSAVAANLESARRNAAQFNSLGSEYNVKPQFLALAAVTKLGNNRGDALQTARSMAETLSKLTTQLGSESADDCLLVMAAYEQGAAGEFLKMRNMLQSLSNKFEASTREIRTIWFLHRRQQISAADYDRALTFLALGTIAQNPKDFGVNIEPLGF